MNKNIRITKKHKEEKLDFIKFVFYFNYNYLDNIIKI